MLVSNSAFAKIVKHSTASFTHIQHRRDRKKSCKTAQARTQLLRLPPKAQHSEQLVCIRVAHRPCESSSRGGMRRTTARAGFPSQAARPAWTVHSQSTEACQYKVRNAQASGFLWHGGSPPVIYKSSKSSPITLQVLLYLYCTWHEPCLKSIEETGAC